ncbi:OmpH family outer membrane protein [Aestuariibaculum sediminum]|uniref:OmpH family outer membrane protein n=1 Tax=Aestuariibaculum sediminum TaxID=2770637 RepID=A0A8J6UHK7_9FLAO|nr:OmpH family outer membrane protein [Aestuariibaculum sediminum]MBD0833026.1 OmpH family outer membrane protein [Aestuariibaculum sediminum]
MKNNVLFLLILVFTLSFSAQAQRGVRIAYIDTEYILENVPEYQEATSQLNDKANKWKSEIDSKLTAVEQKRKDLSNEKALLTKELIEEREEDIAFEEQEILDYQQKRFGPNGDLFIQKRQLMQPVQDQIFAAVQDIAEKRKYDFIFDKSSDATMLFSNSAFDVSEQIIRSISRTSKRTQAQSRAEKRAAEDEELLPEINEELEAREKALKEKQDARESAIEKRRQEILEAREAKQREAEERRQKILEEREKVRQEKLAARQKAAGVSTEETTAKSTEGTKANETGEKEKTQAQLIEENRQKKLAEREARKKELEERRQKILEERQRVKDSITNSRNN